jgi:hypothetical protein
MIHASTWALPVNYDHLIPSLKAYTSIKPTIRTLQTAKTTQQNEKCFIRRMPQELIDHIISYLMAGELGEQDRKWAKLVECRRGRCSRHDHIRASEREDVLQEAADQHGYYVDDSESTFMEAVEEYLAFQYDESVFHDGHYKSIRKYYKYSVVEDEGHLDVTTKRNAMIVAFIEVGSFVAINRQNFSICDSADSW